MESASENHFRTVMEEPFRRFDISIIRFWPIAACRRSQLWFGLILPYRYAANLNSPAVVAKGLELIRGDSLLEKFVVLIESY